MSQHPLDYLPGELWYLLSKYFKNPQDLYHLSEAHPFFFQLLRQKRAEFLLQLVLPVVADFRPGRKWELRPYLLKDELLNCRLVSKRCNQTVTYYFQQHVRTSGYFIPETHRPLWGAGYGSYSLYDGPHLEGCIPLKINRERYQQVDTLLDAAPQTHSKTKDLANPILSREVKLEVVTMEYDLFRGILSTGTRLCQQFGSYLRHCSIVLGLPTLMMPQYMILVSWLRLLPNLESLQVELEAAAGAGGRPRDMIVTDDLFEAYPLPELPSLSKLKMENLPPGMEGAFLQKYEHVGTLHLVFSDADPTLFTPIQLSNLRTLKVEIKSERDLTSLETCMTPSWLRVQTLEMDFVSWWDKMPHWSIPYGNPPRTADSLGWGGIISFLNKTFGEAHGLVKLYLRMPGYDNGAGILEDTHQVRLKLRHVEQLKLKVVNLFLLDFILPMRNSLQKLAIWSPKNDYDRGSLPPNVEVNCRELISWNGWFGRPLLKSNIWSNFQKLKFLRVEYFRGWTYRRSTLGSLFYINQQGREESAEDYVEYVDEDE